MRSKTQPVVPEPPWVWGPSEVAAWIRAAHPSKRRQRRPVREGPEVVARLRVVVEDANPDQVRAALEDALKDVGLASPRRAGTRSRHGVIEAVRPSLVGERLTVSLRFAPPIHVSSCQRIVERLGARVRVHAVSTHERRARLPEKPG